MAGIDGGRKEPCPETEATKAKANTTKQVRIWQGKALEEATLKQQVTTYHCGVWLGTAAELQLRGALLLLSEFTVVQSKVN